MGNKLNDRPASRSLLYAFLATSIAAAIMVICVFLPFGSAIGEHAESIREKPDAILDEELGVVAEDLLHVSIAEYAKYYFGLSEQIWGDSISGVIYVVLASAIGGFALLTMMFALLKKPIAVLIFDLLGFGAFNIEKWDFSDRGVIPSEDYGWGLGYYIFYIGFAVSFVSAIWMLITKIRIKREKKKNELLN